MSSEKSPSDEIGTKTAARSFVVKPVGTLNVSVGLRSSFNVRFSMSARGPDQWENTLPVFAFAFQVAFLPTFQPFCGVTVPAPPPTMRKSRVTVPT